MNYSIIPAAFLVTLFIILLFSLFSKRPVRGLWIFILIIFLATWTGQLWIAPFGPVGWGISWVPLFLVALFFSFFIFALLPPVVPTKEETKAEEGAAIAFGSFFWIMFILLILSIIAGYYRTWS
jgi:hypothetical protein